MSKEFQIRDGDLIASFDLENEDGDIDFCKLLKVSHGVADEIGMFVDYVATNKIIKDQSKKIADLETKLAECEKSKESYRLQNEQHHLQLLQFYSRLGVEAFGADIHEKALETLMIMKEQLAEKTLTIEQINKAFIENRSLWKGKYERANQDKISFAIEQLEKLKVKLHIIHTNGYLKAIDEEIDDQIKELKGKVKRKYVNKTNPPTRR